MFFTVKMYSLQESQHYMNEVEYPQLYDAMVHARRAVQGIAKYQYVIAYIYDAHGQLVRAYHNAGEKITEC